MKCLTPLALMLLAAPMALADDHRDGTRIYKEFCARCHGANGEGAKQYRKPLVGDLSVAQLSKLVRETMPEDDPNTLTQAEADAVAAMMYDTFYSKTARERTKPARIDLTRLTVRQYRGAVADLIGSFRPPVAVGDERGLKAEYYSGRQMRANQKVLDRIDPQIAFDFGTDAPIADKMQHHEFSMRWSGSLLPPETGEYTLLIRTEHAARLWVNNEQKALIDAWVKSGTDTEFSASLFLLAGRPVPIRLEYSKAKQGVDDSKKQKEPFPKVKSSVTLLWKRPNRTPEAIPSLALSPKSTPEQFFVTAPFPPDDRSLGWERGSTVSPEWDRATTAGAIETAGYVLARLDELSGSRGNPSDRTAKVAAFLMTFAERAYRRPLTPDQKALHEKIFKDAPTIEDGVKRVVLLVLKSPFFLYREVGGGNDAWDIAARLSFGLWDSLPDRLLRDAAAKGELATREQILRHADRMLADPRARTKLRDFLLTWLKVDQPHDLTKDAKAFPGFRDDLISDLRTSLELSLDEVLKSDGADYRQLLRSDRIYFNGRMAKYYGVDLPAEAPFTPLPFEGDKRAGLLTHPYVMAAFAHGKETSPIHRGVFLARGILGVALKPPAEAIAPLAPELHPNLTTRERVALQTKESACMTCHNIINPLGFTLEQFDAVGKFRTLEHEKPVDPTGGYLTRSGKSVTLKGAKELSEFLAGSEEAHDAFVEQLVHALAQQPVRAYGPATAETLRKSFVANQFNIRKLAAEIMATTALTGRTVK